MAVIGLSARLATWRTPAVIIACGCAIAMLGFGPRSATGQFLTPISMSNGWGREVFSIALAIQNLLWGAALPFVGAVADRFGVVRVMWVGTLVYAAGLILMTNSTTPGELALSAGVLVGLGLSGCGFNLVISSFGKLLPEKWRLIGFGAGTAAGSFGQFLFSPLARLLIDAFDWQIALIIFAACLLAVLPLSLALATPRESDAPSGVPTQSFGAAIKEAIGHRSYVLLVLGFFTCGFQLAFVTVHLPAYLVDRGLSAEVGGWTIGAIGLCNIFGALTVGWLGNRVPKRYILAVIYFVRAAAILAFIVFPVTPFSAIVFGAVMGFMWLSTVPPTNGLVLVMFGTRWLAMLSGFAFFSHQVGGFLGVLLGGFVFERTGSYDPVWWLSILFGLLSALINLPIVERPAPRVVVVPA